MGWLHFYLLVKIAAHIYARNKELLFHLDVVGWWQQRYVWRASQLLIQALSPMKINDMHLHLDVSHRINFTL